MNTLFQLFVYLLQFSYNNNQNHNMIILNININMNPLDDINYNEFIKDSIVEINKKDFIKIFKDDLDNLEYKYIESSINNVTLYLESYNYNDKSYYKVSHFSFKIPQLSIITKVEATIFPSIETLYNFDKNIFYKLQGTRIYSYKFSGDREDDNEYLKTSNDNNNQIHKIISPYLYMHSNCLIFPISYVVIKEFSGNTCFFLQGINNRKKRTFV